MRAVCAFPLPNLNKKPNPRVNTHSTHLGMLSKPKPLFSDCCALIAERQATPRMTISMLGLIVHQQLLALHKRQRGKS